MDETRTRPEGSGSTGTVVRSLAVVAAVLAVTSVATAGGAAAGPPAGATVPAVGGDASGTGPGDGDGPVGDEGGPDGPGLTGQWSIRTGGTEVADEWSVQPGDAEVTEGGTYFVGQVLWTDAFDPDDDVTLRRADGTLVTDVPVDEDGNVTLRTGSRVPGKYVLRAAAGPEIAFDLVAQEYRVDAPPSVGSSGPDATATFLVESNRNSYRQAISSPDLSGPDLQSLFGTGNLTDVDDDGDAELVVEGGVETELSADFSGLDPGTYTFKFAVTDAAATDSVTVEVLRQEPGRAVFVTESGAVTEERGDVARIPLALENAARATLTVGSDRTGWEVRLTVVDADDDGTVAVLLNTDLAGRVEDPGLAFAAAGADRVESVTRTAGEPFTDPDRRLAAGSYPMFLAVDDEGTDVARLQLRDPGAVERSVGIGRAPARLSGRAVVENATAGNVALGSNVTVAAGDYVVVVLRVAGVFGAIEAAADPSDRPEGVSLRIEEVASHRNERNDAVDPENFTVVPVPSADRIVLVADAGHPDFEVNTTYRVTLTVTDDNPYVDATVSRSATVRVAPRRVSVDAPAGRVGVSAVEDGTIGGTTTVADGTRLTVTVRSDGTATENAEPFLRSRTVVVEDGTWSASFDFSTVPTGQQFTVVVAGAGTTTRVEGAVTPPATVRIENQTRANPRLVTVESVTLPDGGFVAVHDAATFEDDPVGSLLGSSGFLPPGDYEDVRVPLDDRATIDDETEVLAVVYRDTDRNRSFDYLRTGGRADGPYAVGGDPVSDRAKVSPERTPTPTTSTTADQGTTPTVTPTVTPTEGPMTLTSTPVATTTAPGTDPAGTTTTDVTGDGGGGPGFGAAVALLAVLVAALQAIRRRD